MSIYPGFTIANDLSVSLWSVSDPDLFIIGFSLIGGPKELGDAPLAASAIECEVSSVNITKGFDPITSTSFQTSASELQLEMRVRASDPFINANLILGRKIAVEYPTLTLPNQLFVGYISDYSFDYIPGEVVTLSLSAHDGTYYLNSYFVDKPGPPPAALASSLQRHFEYIIDGFTPPQSPGPVEITSYGESWADFIDTSAAIDLFTGTAGELLNNRIEAEQGFYLYYGAGTSGLTYDQLAIITRDQIQTQLASTPSIIFDTTGATGYCPSSLTFSSNIADIDNEVTVDLLQNSSMTLTESDLVSQQRYGINSVSGSFPFLDSTYLASWVDYALNSKVIPQAQSLQASPIDRNGDLVSVVLADPGTVVKVITDYNGAPVNRNYLVTKQTHTITADSWLVDINLWNKN
jgi:hypothetical protein